MQYIDIHEKKWALIVILEKILDMEVFEHSTTQLKNDEEKEFYHNFINESILLNGLLYKIEDSIFENVIKYLEFNKIIEVIFLNRNQVIDCVDDTFNYIAERIKESPDVKVDDIVKEETFYCGIVVRDLDWIKNKIENLNSQGVSLEVINKKFEKSTFNNSKPYFDEEKSILRFKGKEIVIAKNKASRAHFMLGIIFKDTERNWSYMDIIDEMGGNDYKKEDWKKFWQAVNGINKKIAEATTINDFLIITSKEVEINKKYLI